MQIIMIWLPAPASKTPCCGKDAGTREGSARTLAQLSPAGALLSASAVARLVCVSLGFLPIGLTRLSLWSPGCLQAPSSWRGERTCPVGSPRDPARFSAPNPSLDRQPVQSPRPVTLSMSGPQVSVGGGASRPMVSALAARLAPANPRVARGLRP